MNHVVNPVRHIVKCAGGAIRNRTLNLFVGQHARGSADRQSVN